MLQPPLKKTVCELTGHNWQNTAAANVRRCTRSDCRLVQRRAPDGQWVTLPKRSAGPGDADAPALVNLWECAG